jgi:hypothetical protein
MTIDPDSNKTIFESPDKGETIYARQPGSTVKTLIKEPQRLRKWNKFKAILEMAETEPALNDLLDKAEMLYDLIKDERT